MGIAVFPAAGGGVTPKVQTFTSTGTFTAPSNCTMVSVLLVGAGGGGGYIKTAGNRQGSGGGAGGEVIELDLSVTAGSSYTVTIGAGGAGATSVAAGGTGGNTTFGSLATAYGGGGGGSTDGVAATYAYATKGGGMATDRDLVAGGCGGGAGGYATAYGNGPSAATAAISPLGYSYTLNTNRVSGGGGATWSVDGTAAQVAGPGLKGFGNGGAGGFTTRTSIPSQGFQTVSYSGTGAPGYFNVAGSQVAAVNASANTGDGGHGATTAAVANATCNGSNGGSGYAIVSYWS